jgi:hypothetical protein
MADAQTELLFELLFDQPLGSEEGLGQDRGGLKSLLLDRHGMQEFVSPL